MTDTKPVSADKTLVECLKCEGEGVVTELVGDPDAPPHEEADGMGEMLTTEEVECDRCDGRGTEYEGAGCPRCGADGLSSTLMPSSCYKQQCGECGWWELAG